MVGSVLKNRLVFLLTCLMIKYYTTKIPIEIARARYDSVGSTATLPFKLSSISNSLTAQFDYNHRNHTSSNNIILDQINLDENETKNTPWRIVDCNFIISLSVSNWFSDLIQLHLLSEMFVMLRWNWGNRFRNKNSAILHVSCWNRPYQHAEYKMYVLDLQYAMGCDF